MMTPLEFAPLFVKRWEDGNSTDPIKTHSLDPDDAGNWSSGVKGHGLLIGSNHGVTPAALASFRKVPVAAITLADMRALTLSEAAAIALQDYYNATGINKLPWNAVTASLFDFRYNSGSAIAVMQRMLGLKDDGAIGPKTVGAYTAWINARTPEQAARTFANVRIERYKHLVEIDPANKKYINGWTNRANYYSPVDINPPEHWYERFMS